MACRVGLVRGGRGEGETCPPPAPHQAPADLQGIVEAGRGDVPLKDLKFRCTACGSRRIDAMVMGRAGQGCSRGGGTLETRPNLFEKLGGLTFRIANVNPLLYLLRCLTGQKERPRRDEWRGRGSVGIRIVTYSEHHCTPYLKPSRISERELEGRPNRSPSAVQRPSGSPAL